MRDEITTYNNYVTIVGLKKMLSKYQVNLKDYSVEGGKRDSKVIQRLLYRLPLKETIIFVWDGNSPFNLYCVHGKKLFTTIVNFHNNEFKLTGVNDVFNDKFFDDLSNLLQNRFEETILDIKVIQTTVALKTVCQLLDIAEVI